MQQVILPNGLKILYLQRATNTVCIEVNVHAGSNNESPATAGISHFIEHMLFEGTKRRPNSFLVSNEIERLGGDLNAATSNERTFFYIKVLNKHFDVALDVMSDILMNPLFQEAIIAKEKKIVIDEIKLVNDQPRYYQWILFQNTLFRKHPAKNPIYGSIDTIQSLSRRQVLEYYRTHYTPQNMTMVVVGNVQGALSKIRTKFILSGSYQGKTVKVREPPQETNIVRRIRKKTLQSYVVLGYQTPARKHADSYTLDVMRAILGRGQSGKIFDEIRTKRGLAYDVGVLHNPSTDFGFFAVYVNTNVKNVPAVRRIILDELHKLKKTTDTELSEAQTFLEGEFLLQVEDNQKMADLIAFYDQADKTTSSANYVKRIKMVTKRDIAAAVDRYFRYYTMTQIS